MERRGERLETIISAQKNSTHQLLERVLVLFPMDDAKASVRILT